MTNKQTEARVSSFCCQNSTGSVCQVVSTEVVIQMILTYKIHCLRQVLYVRNKMKESSNEKLNEKFHNEQNTMKEEVLTDMPPSNKNECCSANNYEDVMDNYGEEEEEEIPGVKFVNYHDESQIHSVMRLVGKDLSEPYSGK